VAAGASAAMDAAGKAVDAAMKAASEPAKK
jgi:hypothetical protein